MPHMENFTVFIVQLRKLAKLIFVLVSMYTLGKGDLYKITPRI